MIPEGIAPPVLVGIAVGDIAVLLVKIKSLGEYDITGGVTAVVKYSRVPLV